MPLNLSSYFLYPQLKDESPENLKKVDNFFQANRYVKGSYTNDSDFEQLNSVLESLEGGEKCNRLFYLALPPSVFKDVTTHIKGSCMSKK